MSALTSTSPTHLEGIKRKINSENDDQTSEKSTKRARAMQMTPTFQQCHLIMLKSLYGNEEISSTIWNSIESFLKQRPVLLKAKQKRQHLEGIHQEAVKFASSFDKSTSPNNAKSPSQFLPPPTQPSPSLSMFTPRSPAVSNNATATGTQRNGILLVARLLEKRVESTFDERQFAALSQEVNNQIDQLKQTLSSLLEEKRQRDEETLQNLLHSRSVNNDTLPKDNGLVETSTKIQLWTMLAHSLRSIE